MIYPSSPHVLEYTIQYPVCPTPARRHSFILRYFLAWRQKNSRRRSMAPVSSSPAAAAPHLCSSLTMPPPKQRGGKHRSPARGGGGGGGGGGAPQQQPREQQAQVPVVPPAPVATPVTTDTTSPEPVAVAAVVSSPPSTVATAKKPASSWASIAATSNRTGRTLAAAAATTASHVNDDSLPLEQAQLGALTSSSISSTEQLVQLSELACAPLSSWWNKTSSKASLASGASFVRPRIRGLINDGRNLCFMNSVLQGLFAAEPFAALLQYLMPLQALSNRSTSFTRSVYGACACLD